MGIEKKLRRLQDNLRDGGWRIKHIPWQPEGKLEMYGPGSPLGWLLCLSGLGCFFGGAFLLTGQGIPAWVTIAVMLFGLALLFCTRFVSGRDLYGHFVAVDAICLDREVQEYEDPEDIGSFPRKTYWHPRILCQFTYQGKDYQVTPIIVKMVAFNSKDAVHRFLDERVDSKGKCALWVNPKNPLHTVFHTKPKTGPYTV